MAVRKKGKKRLIRTPLPPHVHHHLLRPVRVQGEVAVITQTDTEHSDRLGTRYRGDLQQCR